MKNIIAFVKLFTLTFGSIFIGVFLTIGLKFKLDKFHEFFLRLWFKFACAVSGVSLKIEGLPKNEDKNFGFYIISNHCSYMDIPVCGRAIYAHFTPKGDIKKWPIVGWLTTCSKPVYIERGNKRSIGKQNEKMIDFLKQKNNVIVFAEGTTNDGINIHPLKAGAFALTDHDSAANLPILPMTVKYTHLGGKKIDQTKINPVAWVGDDSLLPHLWNLFKQGNIKAEIKFHEILYRKDFASRKELAKECDRLVRNN